MTIKIFKGKWNIYQTDQWDTDDTDCIEFGDKGNGILNFADFQLEIDCRFNNDDEKVEFTLHGNDIEGTEVFGRGWTAIDGVDLHGYVQFHQGEETEFKAKKVKQGLKSKKNLRTRK